MLIDVAIPADRNVIKKETEKILKHKDLITEIRCMSNVKTKLIAVITGATGTVSESRRQYPSNIPGKPQTKEQQKQPYMAQHANCGKYKFAYIKHISGVK